MHVRKAVIPAAGLGTRFLPATKSIPKEMLPVVDRPMVQYVVEEGVAAGMTHFVFVISQGKESLEEYFRPDPTLERFLAEKGDQANLERVRRPAQLASFSSVLQREPRGLGHAILTARKAVGDEPFAVLLPDDIIAAPEPALAQMLRVFHRYGASVVAVEELPQEELGSYGVIQGEEVEEGVYRLEGLVEKPDPAQAPSNLGIVGRYLFTPEIFKALERTPLGAKGEIQVTDGMGRLLQRQPLYAYRFRGTRYDAGTPLGWIEATVGLALGRPDLRPQVVELLQRLLQDPSMRRSR
ncbi:MAG: UTP--glucose-1-phosphate uridylyltransferase GalU [Dehalococcoidia bacterium]